MTDPSQTTPAGEPQHTPEVPIAAPPAPAPGYAPPAYGQPVPPQFAPAAPPKTNTFALVAIITVWFGGLLGIIFGHIGLSQIKKTREGGRGLAIAALVVGYAGMVIGAIVLAVMLAFAATAAPAITKAVQCAEIAKALNADPDFLSAMTDMESKPDAAAVALEKLVASLHTAGTKVSDGDLKRVVSAAETALSEFRTSIVAYSKDPASLDTDKFQKQMGAVQTTVADLTASCTGQ